MPIIGQRVAPFLWSKLKMVLTLVPYTLSEAVLVESFGIVVAPHRLIYSSKI